MIRIIDYGVGNTQAFLNVYKRLGLLAGRARTVADLEDATRLVLPGVGAFDHAIQRFSESGMRETVENLVLNRQIPILGVCVGMQMLASSSEEGVLPGLNWVPGRVRAFANTPEWADLPMPHMGWNEIAVQSQSMLFSAFEPHPRFYFLHSFYFDCQVDDHVAATASYGIDFACIVSNGHIHGVQCHPEKSHHFGAQLLKNFAEL